MHSVTHRKVSRLREYSYYYWVGQVKDGVRGWGRGEVRLGGYAKAGMNFSNLEL